MPARDHQTPNGTRRTRRTNRTSAQHLALSNRPREVRNGAVCLTDGQSARAISTRRLARSDAEHDGTCSARAHSRWRRNDLLELMSSDDARSPRAPSRGQRDDLLEPISSATVQLRIGRAHDVDTMPRSNRVEQKASVQLVRPRDVGMTPRMK